MILGPIIGRRLFDDGIVRTFFLDGVGRQCVIGTDGRTSVYCIWL
jgi:hypothetical protein